MAEDAALARELRQDFGIALRPAWVAMCVQRLRASHPQAPGWTASQLKQQVLAQALHADLKTIGEPCLPPDLQTYHKQLLRGKYVLQVDEVVNMAASARDRYSGTTNDKCLSLNLTDGTNHVCAMEYRALRDIHWNCPAGAKIVVENVQCRRGVLLLQPENCAVLGGKVEALEAARQRAVACWNKEPEGRSRDMGQRDIFTEARAAAWAQDQPPQGPQQPQQQPQLQQQGPQPGMQQQQLQQGSGVVARPAAGAPHQQPGQGWPGAPQQQQQQGAQWGAGAAQVQPCHAQQQQQPQQAPPPQFTSQSRPGQASAGQPQQQAAPPYQPSGMQWQQSGPSTAAYSRHDAPPARTNAREGPGASMGGQGAPQQAAHYSGAGAYPSGGSSGAVGTSRPSGAPAQQPPLQPQPQQPQQQWAAPPRPADSSFEFPTVHRPSHQANPSHMHAEPAGTTAGQARAPLWPQSSGEWRAGDQNPQGVRGAGQPTAGSQRDSGLASRPEGAMARQGSAGYAGVGPGQAGEQWGVGQYGASQGAEGARSSGASWGQQTTAGAGAGPRPAGIGPAAAARPPLQDIPGYNQQQPLQQHDSYQAKQQGVQAPALHRSGSEYTWRSAEQQQQPQSQGQPIRFDSQPQQQQQQPTGVQAASGYAAYRQTQPMAHSNTNNATHSPFRQQTAPQGPAATSRFAPQPQPQPQPQPGPSSMPVRGSGASAQGPSHSYSHDQPGVFNNPPAPRQRISSAPVIDLISSSSEDEADAGAHRRHGAAANTGRQQPQQQHHQQQQAARAAPAAAPQAGRAQVSPWGTPQQPLDTSALRASSHAPQGEGGALSARSVPLSSHAQGPPYPAHQPGPASEPRYPHTAQQGGTYQGSHTAPQGGSYAPHTGPHGSSGHPPQAGLQGTAYSQPVGSVGYPPQQQAGPLSTPSYHTPQPTPLSRPPPIPTAGRSVVTDHRSRLAQSGAPSQAPPPLRSAELIWHPPETQSDTQFYTQQESEEERVWSQGQVTHVSAIQDRMLRSGRRGAGGVGGSAACDEDRLVLILGVFQSVDGEVARVEDGTGIIHVTLSDQAFQMLTQGYSRDDLQELVARGGEDASRAHAALDSAKRILSHFHGLILLELPDTQPTQQPEHIDVVPDTQLDQPAARAGPRAPAQGPRLWRESRDLALPVLLGFRSADTVADMRDVFARLYGV